MQTYKCQHPCCACQLSEKTKRVRLQDLIIEMQHSQYNLGAPLAKDTQPYVESLGWKCVAPLFCNNGPDGDYHFVRSN